MYFSPIFKRFFIYKIHSFMIDFFFYIIIILLYNFVIFSTTNTQNITNAIEIKNNCKQRVVKAKSHWVKALLNSFSVEKKSKHNICKHNTAFIPYNTRLERNVRYQYDHAENILAILWTSVDLYGKTSSITTAAPGLELTRYLMS